MVAESRPVVLLLEDDGTIRDALAGILDDLGCEVRCAASVEAASTIGLPDLLIADVRLEDGSGLDVACRLREIEPRLPVVITAGNPDDVGDRLPPGAVLVAKPFDVDELESVLGRFLPSLLVE